MKRVMITGATGSIGTALVDNLLSRGIEVCLILRADSPRNSRLPEHPLLKKIYCVLQNFSSLQNTEQESYDVFFHFAWEGTSGANRQEIAMQVGNIRGALDAVELAKRFHCQTFVGAGSQAEYGRVEGELKRNTPAYPDNGYGIAKLCAGQMCRERARQLGIKFHWVRIVSVYGPYDGEQTMIMSTIAKLLSGARAPLTACEQMWDYLYSADAAEAFYKIGKHGKDGKTYVLGSGTARPLAEYVHTIAHICHAEDKIDIGALPYAERQVMYLKADISEIIEDTGWTPDTDFSKGVEQIVKKITSNLQNVQK